MTKIQQGGDCGRKRDIFDDQWQLFDNAKENFQSYCSMLGDLRDGGVVVHAALF